MTLEIAHRRHMLRPEKTIPPRDKNMEFVAFCIVCGVYMACRNRREALFYATEHARNRKIYETHPCEDYPTDPRWGANTHDLGHDVWIEPSQVFTPHHPHISLEEGILEQEPGFEHSFSHHLEHKRRAASETSWKLRRMKGIK